MQIPNSLQTLLAILLAGFVFSVWSTKRAKVNQVKYEKIGDVSNPINGSRIPVNREISTISSYQDSAAVYALSPKSKNDITYCVIDGRLIDNS